MKWFFILFYPSDYDLVSGEIEAFYFLRHWTATRTKRREVALACHELREIRR